MPLGSHTIKTWSATQGVIALSSGEAEYYAMVRGASQAMGMRSMLKDVGVDALDLRVLTATAMLFQAAYAPSRADTDEKKAAEKKKTCKGAIEYIKARFARL